MKKLMAAVLLGAAICLRERLADLHETGQHWRHTAGNAAHRAHRRDAGHLHGLATASGMGSAPAPLRLVFGIYSVYRYSPCLPGRAVCRRPISPWTVVITRRSPIV